MGISYDPTEKRIYWTDVYGGIRGSLVNGSFPQVLEIGLGTPKGIEIDVVGRNIYFANEAENNIRVKAIDGSYQAILVNVESPQGIALDSLSG